jgi:hypothetical protein
MKMQDRIFFKQALKPVVFHLTNFVEENFVKELKNPTRRIFSLADLWNIQRHKKRLLVR